MPAFAAETAKGEVEDLGKLDAPACSNGWNSGRGGR